MGVDSSTQSCKVEIRDLATGERLGAGKAAHPVDHRRAGRTQRSEQDPGSWWDALVAATRQATADSSGGPGNDWSIAAMSVAGQQHGMVVLDAQDQVIRPAKLWNDTESAEQAERLVRGNGQAWAGAVGSVPVASFTITKLAWLEENEPDIFARIAKVLLPHDWLTFRITGRAVTDRGDASGTGYWSPSEGRWCPDLLAEHFPNRSTQEWIASLPEVLAPFDRAGCVTAEAAQQLGFRDTVVVGPGTGDNMAAALGVGLRPGELTISIGTSGTVFAVSETPTADPTGAVAGFADATGRFLPLVCTLNATLVTEAFARMLDVEVATLDRLAFDVPSGARGLVLVPYLAGERTPNRPDATGVLSGIRPDVTRGEMARAAFEGVVFGLLDGMDALDAAGVCLDGERTVLVGGGARSATYRKAMADLSGRAITVPHADELVALGACVQAAAVFADEDPELVADRWQVRAGEVTEPDRSLDRASIRAAFIDARG